MTGAALLLVVALAPSSSGRVAVGAVGAVGLGVDDGSSLRASARASDGNSGCCTCCCCDFFFFLRRFDDFIDDDPDVRKLKERREKRDEEVDVVLSGKFGGGVVGDVGDTVLASDNPGECSGMLDSL